SFSPPLSPFTHVAISRDGRRLAVLGVMRNGPMIFVRRLEDSVFEAVRGSEGAISVALSADAESLAFHIRDHGAFRLSVHGGTPQLVADSAEFPRWGESGEMVFRTPDGNALGFVRPNGSTSKLLRPDSAGRMESPSLLPGGRDVLVSRSS